MTRASDTVPVTDDEAFSLFRAFMPEHALVLAVSGGPDSMALLWLAARWRAALTHGPHLLAVTVNHGLRKDAAREANMVKGEAAKLGVAHRTLKWTGEKPASGIQAAARQARYRLLAQAARSIQATCILTAHTLDDQAETVLMRLAAGSGVSGLSGMKPVGPMPSGGDGLPVLHRPLLGVPKSRLTATVTAAGLPFVRDPTNQDPSYLRPRLRASTDALSREGLTPKRLGLLANRVQRVERAIEEAVNAAQDRLAPRPWPEGQPVVVPAAGFRELPAEFALRLMERGLNWCGDEGPVELGKLEALMEALDAAFSEGHTIRFRRTLAGAVVTLTRGQLTIAPAPPRRSKIAGTTP